MKVNEETTISEEQVLFNKLSYEEQQFILKQMRMLQPCELSCVEENKIPEKLGYQDNANGTFYLNRKKYNSEPIKILSKKINDIIDYLDYLKSKGE